MLSQNTLDFKVVKENEKDEKEKIPGKDEKDKTTWLAPIPSDSPPTQNLGRQASTISTSKSTPSLAPIKDAPAPSKSSNHIDDLIDSEYN